MDQIDLVPTLAAILGTPIPYSNLGSINLDIIPNVPVNHLSADVVKMLHSWQNAIQMRYFFSNYTQDNKETFTADMQQDLFTKFYIFSMRVSSLYTSAALDNFSKDVKIYLQDIAAKCRMVWVKFDANQMSQGLLFTAVVNIFVFLLVMNLKYHQFEVVFSPSNLLFIYASNGGLGLLAYFFCNRFGVESREQGVLMSTSIYSIALIAFLIVQNWDIISNNWSQQKNFSNLSSRIFLGFSVVVFYSNSFVVQEQKILCYLLAGTIVIFLYKIRKQSVRFVVRTRLRLTAFLTLPYAKLLAAAIFGILLLRISYSFHRCREEQGNCTDFLAQNSHGGDWRNPLPSGINANPLQLFPIITLAIFVTISRQFLRKCGNLSGFSPHVILARYGPSVAAIACGGHFFMTLTKKSKLSTGINQIRTDAMAWIVYGIFAAQLVVLIGRPLLLFILQRANRQIDVSPFGRVVPQIFMKMKRMYEEGTYGQDGNRNDDDIPIVYGLATVYSSVFWSVATVFVFVLAILLGPLAAHGIFVTITLAGLILILNAVLRYQHSSRLGKICFFFKYICGSDNERRN